VRYFALRTDGINEKQNLLSNRDFQRLEIQIGDRLAPHQGLNLLNDVDGQQIAESPGAPPSFRE
jgi:hypothetical protein